VLDGAAYGALLGHGIALLAASLDENRVEHLHHEPLLCLWQLRDALDLLQELRVRAALAGGGRDRLVEELLDGQAELARDDG
jgi:hypothetical protein